jgi:hypothetical protein
MLRQMRLDRLLAKRFLVRQMARRIVQVGMRVVVVTGMPKVHSSHVISLNVLGPGVEVGLADRAMVAVCAVLASV